MRADVAVQPAPDPLRTFRPAYSYVRSEGEAALNPPFDGSREAVDQGP